MGVDKGNRDKKQNTWSIVYKRGGGQTKVFDDVHEEVLDEDDNQDCIGTGCYQVNKKIRDPDWVFLGLPAQGKPIPTIF